VNLSNLANIKIESLDDKFNLGERNISVEASDESTKGLQSVGEVVAEFETEEGMSENLAEHEIKMIHRLEVDPDHYAEINDDMFVGEFVNKIGESGNLEYGGDAIDINLPDGDFAGSGYVENRRLGGVLNYLVENGKIENSSQTISEALRRVSEADFNSALSHYEGIFGEVPEPSSDLNYSDYMGAVIENELKEIMQSGSNGGAVIGAMAEIRESSMSDMANNELLKSFKEAVRSSVGNVEHENDGTVGGYVVKALKKSYELGDMGKLKDAISKIELSK